MFLDTFLCQLLCHQTCHGSLSLIFTLHELDVSHFDKSVFLNPVSVVDVLELPLHFVFIGLLFFLLTTINASFWRQCNSKVSSSFLGIVLRINTTTHITACAVNAPLLCTSGFLLH